jgi:ribulose-phosphate 3-epimerase
MPAPLISPSILSADFARLGEEVRADRRRRGRLDPCRRDGRAFRAQHHHRPDGGEGAAPAHRQAVRRPPDDRAGRSLSQAFAEAGADIITVHPEAGRTSTARSRRSRRWARRPAWSLNPGTPAKMLDYLIDDIDLVLVMSVNPGFGGQSFIASQLRKIEASAR